MNPETKFKLKVFKDLRTLKKIWFYKSQEISLRGIPDVIICLNGIFVVLELKKDEKEAKLVNRTTALQKHNLSLIKRCRGKAFLVWPENWKKVFKKIAEMGIEPITESL
jgi:hypothetical protein